MLARLTTPLLWSLLGTVALVGSVGAVPGSVELFVNDAGASNYDYGEQLFIPPGFGDGEFTLEVWLRPNESFPVGSVSNGADQRQNWAINDIQPYSSCCWWTIGNFLLDGHNNRSWSLGTFDLQFYGGGRVRWLFGDGALPQAGEVWSVGAYPADSTASLLDGRWHQVTLVRRWSGTSSAQLELWVDGVLIDTETTPARTNMRQWWDDWSDFRQQEIGWFWGAEKQAAIGAVSQYEDYKGLVDELRFWSRAKTAAEISQSYADAITGNEPGLVGYYDFGEGQGNAICDAFNGDPDRCITLRNAYAGVWSSDEAPLTSGSDVTPPSTPGNLQGSPVSMSQIDLTWNAATDNVGVVAYQVRRDGIVVGNSNDTTFSDQGLAADTSYMYTVAALDAAGNVSTQSSPVSVTTLSGSDQQPPDAPSDLQGNAVSSSRIDLAWTASTDNVGVTGYSILRNGAITGTTAATNFSDSGLAPNTTYAYSVTAGDAAGNESPPSMEIFVTTLAGPDTNAPTPPGNARASAVSMTIIDVSWTAASDNVGVAEYAVSRDGTEIAVTPATQIRDAGLAANTLYTYTIVAVDAAGNRSAESSPASARTLSTPDTQAPTPPAGLRTTFVSANGVELRWDAASDNVAVVEYRVFRDDIETATTADTQFSDSGLNAAATYTYRVVARDAAGNASDPSAALSVTTIARNGPEAEGGGGGCYLLPLLALGLLIRTRRWRSSGDRLPGACLSRRID